jgi:Spy/CpxP family protein refolding chaperone
MNLRLLKIALLSACLAAGAGSGAFGQARPPGGGPLPGGPGPGGGPGPTGGPGGFPGPPPTGSGSGVKSDTSHFRQQFGPVGRWWDDKSVVQTVGLSRAQQKKMDSIFNANKPAIVESYKAFLKEQSKLETLTKDPKADKASVFAAIDAVSRSHAALQKAATAMYLQIRQQLDPDQIARLEKLQ